MRKARALAMRLPLAPSLSVRRIMKNNAPAKLPTIARKKIETNHFMNWIMV